MKIRIETCTVVFFLLCFLNCKISISQELCRKAIRGFSYKSEENRGIILTSIDKNSPAEKAGLKIDDIVLEINGFKLSGYENRTRILSQLPSKKKLEFKIIRDNEPKVISVKLDPIPQEKYSNTVVEYGSIIYDGDTLRTITSKPKKMQNKKLPAVFLVQWLSCGSIDIPGEPADGMDFTIKSFANNPNIIFHRIDKSGVGDSRGTACIDLDANREIAAYKKGLSELKKRPDVDVSQIYILGLSLGTSLAPIVGENEGVKGYMVSGGTTVTWYEHMLDFERNRLTLSGNSPTEVNESMKKFTDFYYQYLVKKKTPEQIIGINPIYESLWYDDPRHQFGRSASYYQQVQELNFEEAWNKVNVPTLILYGEYDWVMSLQDHQMIVELVNKNDNTLATLKVLPKTGHLLSSFPTLKDSFKDEIGKINSEAYDLMWNWLKNKIQ